MASESDSDVYVKTIHLPQANSDVAEREFVLKLLELYRDKPLLWDTCNENYTNKYKRIDAMKKICNCLKQFKPNYTVEELKKKLNILRTNFNKERNKIELTKKSLAHGEGPEPTLWYYNEMTFLIGKQVPGIKQLNLNIESTRDKLLRNRRRKKISIISEPSTGIKKSENEEEILVKCWAMKLRKLSPHQRLYAEKIINDTLFEAELGTLTRHGASFNTDPLVWTQYSAETHSPVCKSPTS